MSEQIKYKFDSVTLKKIAKGAFYAGLYGAGMFLVSKMNGVDLGNSTLNGLLLAVIPFIGNAIKEWYAGTDELIK